MRGEVLGLDRPVGPEDGAVRGPYTKLDGSKIDTRPPEDLDHLGLKNVQIVEVLEKRGWPRAAFWPHGGHLFCLHVVAALGLGGAEVNPLCFQPFGGYGNNTKGVATPSQIPGIGFEARPDLRDLLATLLDV